MSLRTAQLLTFALLNVVTGCTAAERQDSEPIYVGSTACAACHGEVARVAAGGAHALAMQTASDTSVSGRFDGARLTHFGATTAFLERAAARYVRTADASAELGEFEITHVIGVHPLEQYLVQFPDGRYQVLPFAWDTRAPGQGGGRWFHMHPDDSIPPTDELHWTGPLQTWNYMCAECHVTGLDRGYDVATDRYATTWRELGVQCEACHGPGSRHVAWAQEYARDSTRANAAYAMSSRGLLVDLSTRRGGWVFDSGAAIAHRTVPPGRNAQVEMCGVCHARRETLVSTYVPGRPLLATHRPVLLEEGLYHADGQLLDEVYEYGSFVQSRMYRAGVTCTDCHDPSTMAVASGNAACARCHQPGVFDTPSHHHHDNGAAGASCVSCHMPPRTYMVIDPRHDHSIRIPRPDLSLRIGSPNACTNCHADRSNAWAARAALQWYGAPDPDRHYGDVLAAGRRGAASADTALIRLVGDTAEAGIVRATAVTLLRGYPTAAAAALVTVARDADPLVRLAAAITSDVLPPDARLRATSHLLTDSLLAIRVEAARALADVPDAMLTAAQRGAFDDFVVAQRVNADQPESHLRLGVFYQQRGRLADAERAYRDAIRIRPRYEGGYANLADLHRTQNRDAEGERVLRNGIAQVRHPGVLHHSLGLLLVRKRALDEALVELTRAVELEPDVTRFAHVLAVALHSMGRTADALRVLEDARRRAPNDPEIAEALATIRG